MITKGFEIKDKVIEGMVSKFEDCVSILNKSFRRHKSMKLSNNMFSSTEGETSSIDVLSDEDELSLIEGFDTDDLNDEFIEDNLLEKSNNNLVWKPPNHIPGTINFHFLIIFI